MPSRHLSLAWEVCPASCKCGKGVGPGAQVSLDIIFMYCEVAAERARNGFSDRFAFRLDSDLAALRAEMAGVLAAL